MSLVFVFDCMNTSILVTTKCGIEHLFIVFVRRINCIKRNIHDIMEKNEYFTITGNFPLLHAMHSHCA